MCVTTESRETTDVCLRDDERQTLSGERVYYRYTRERYIHEDLAVMGPCLSPIEKGLK